MIDLILGNGTALILLAVFGVGFVGVIWWKGADWQARRERGRDAKATTDTHRRIDNAPVSEGDPAADLDWLRRRGMRTPRK